MKENKFRSALTGIILGVIFGNLYYGWPVKLLITGTIPSDGLFLPEGVNSYILQISMKWGSLVGAVIGFLGGRAISIKMPRGHMAKAISCTTFLVCVPLAFIMYGSQLLLMPAGRITILFVYIFFLFLMTIPMGSLFGFIEKIRE